MNTTASPFQPRPDGMIALAAPGEVPAEIPDPQDPKKTIKVVQVFDRECFRKIAEDLRVSNREILIDYDHQSYDMGERTTAAGWIKGSSVQDSPEGLFAPPRWSACGKADVDGGNVRFTSPVFAWPKDFQHLGGDRYRPIRLDSVAVTNRPRHTGMPPITILNRDANPPANPKPKPMDYKASLLALLGLAATATDPEITAAVAAYKKEESAEPAATTAMTNRIATLEAELINRDLDVAGVTDAEERKAWSAMLKHDRASASTLLKNRKAPEAPEKKGEQKTPLHNRAETKTPATVDAKADAENARAERIRNRAQEICRTERVGFAIAFSRAEAETPAVAVK